MISVSHIPPVHDDNSLPALLLRSPEPVIVESQFGGWSKPWRAFDENAWQELQREFGERINCARIDTAVSRAFALRHGLEILPEVLVFLGGAVVARFHGRVTVADVARAIRDSWIVEGALDVARAELDASAAAPSRSRSVARARAASDALLARVG